MLETHHVGNGPRLVGELGQWVPPPQTLGGVDDVEGGGGFPHIDQSAGGTEQPVELGDVEFARVQPQPIARSGSLHPVTASIHGGAQAMDVGAEIVVGAGWQIAAWPYDLGEAGDGNDLVEAKRQGRQDSPLGRTTQWQRRRLVVVRDHLYVTQETYLHHRLLQPPTVSAASFAIRSQPLRRKATDGERDAPGRRSPPLTVQACAGLSCSQWPAPWWDLVSSAVPRRRRPCRWVAVSTAIVPRPMPPSRCSRATGWSYPIWRSASPTTRRTVLGISASSRKGRRRGGFPSAARPRSSCPTNWRTPGKPLISTTSCGRRT